MPLPVRDTVGTSWAVVVEMQLTPVVTCLSHLSQQQRHAHIGFCMKGNISVLLTQYKKDSLNHAKNWCNACSTDTLHITCNVYILYLTQTKKLLN